MSGNWTLVQTKHVAASSGSADTLPGTYSSNVTAGNLLAVIVSAYPNSTSGFSVSDGTNSLMSQMNAGSTSDPFVDLFTEICPSGIGGTTPTMTLTAPSGGSPSLAMIIQEWSFTPGTLHYGTPSTSTGNSTTPSAGSVVVGTVPSLVLGAISSIAQTGYASNGLTLLDHIGLVTSTSMGAAVGGDLNVSSTTVTCSLTTASAAWAAAAISILSSGDGILLGTSTLNSSNQTGASVTFGTPQYGTSPYTINVQVALAPGGTPGTPTTVGQATATSPFAITGLIPNTLYAVRQYVTDSTTPTALNATGPWLLFATGYVYDTFQAANGTVIVGSSYLSNTGATYSQLTSYGIYGAIIESDALYGNSGSASANPKLQITNVTCDLNAPVQITFSYVNGIASGVIGVVARAQSSGAAYCAQLTLLTCAVSIAPISGGGIGTAFASFTPSAALATGSYKLILAPWNQAFAAYIQRVSDGKWLNTSSAFQAAKTPVCIGADNTTMVAGVPGLMTGVGATQTDAASITAFSAGNSLFLPTDLGCKLVTDRLAVITALPAEGGVQPIASYSLAYGPHGGGLSTIGNVTAGLPFTHAGLSASTSYDYQVTVADGNGNTAQSAILTITTRATESITSPTLTSGSIAAWINGTIPLDTSGNPLQLHNGSVFWSPRYNMYFACGDLIDATHGPTNTPDSTYVYGSLDLMNWTYLGVGFSTATMSVPSTNLWNRPKIIEDPADGMYYGIVTSQVSLVDSVISFQATVPWGPYTYIGSLGAPNGGSDYNAFIDYDGSRWLSMYNSGWAAVPSGWASLGTNYSGGPSGEGVAPFRYGRVLYTLLSPENLTDGWGPTANFAAIWGIESSTSPGHINNSTIFTTAAEALAAPAGGPPYAPTGSAAPGGFQIAATISAIHNSGNITASTTPSGITVGASLAIIGDSTNTLYTVSSGTDPNFVISPVYGGTTASGLPGRIYGIDPTLAYSSQCDHVFVTATGQYIAMQDRWTGSGIGVGTNTLIWLPITFDSVGNPQIPFVVSFVPSARLPGGIFRQGSMDGLGGGGPFFSNPLTRV